MRDEISAAVLFLVRLIERSENFNQAQLDEFKARLSDVLMERFENHWFPEKPCKGQGYRCIRVNECSRRDATLERAALACGLKYEDLKLPVELTIWVDPKEVCCRFGEHKGSYCTLASFPGQDNEVKVVVENCPPEVKLEAPVSASNCTIRSSVSSSPTQMALNSAPGNPISTTATTAATAPTAPSPPHVQAAPGKETKSKVPVTIAAPAATANANTNQRNPATSSSSTSATVSTTNTSTPSANTNHNNRSRGQNSPKQGSKAGGRKSWGGPAYQHPLQAWYNVLPPHPWMPASPPPYMLRSPPRSTHPSHHRYHWAPHKPTLKV